MQKPAHWPSILVLGVLVIAVVLFMLAALGFGIVSIMGLVKNGPDPAGSMIGAISTAFEGILLGVVAWFILQKTRGRVEADQPFQLPFSGWHILAMLVLGGIALMLGAAVSYLEIKFLSWVVLPLLTLFLIVPPIWVFLGLGTRKLDFGPRWQALGIFGLGMTIGPLIMIVLETVLLVIVAVLIVIVIAQEPGKLQELTQLASILRNETDPERMLQMLEPYVFNPTVLKLVIGYIALAVPMIEELLKPLGVWLFARQIQKPAQGFALGLLSGAAYALVESLGASGQGDTSWSVVVAVRAGTSLLHITTTGLMGWAIIAAFHQGRWGRLLGTYLTVILIHGIWNGSAIGAGLAVTSDIARNTSWSISILPAALCGLMVLLFGMIGLLLASNQRARKLSATTEAPQVQSETEARVQENPEGGENP